MMRYSREYRLGEAGAVYEFNVKLNHLRGVNISDDDLQFHVMVAFDTFRDKLRQRYTWIGDVSLTGRSSGWLAIQDRSGKAKRSTLETINKLVTNACRKFQVDLRAKYGTRDPLTVGALIKALRRLDPGRLVYANLQERPPLAVTRVIPDPADAPGMILLNVVDE